MSVPVGTKLPHREGGEGVFIVVQTREGNEERRPGPDNRDVTRGGGGGCARAGGGMGRACARAGEGGDRVDEGDHQGHESFSVALCVRITINIPDWLQHAL